MQLGELINFVEIGEYAICIIGSVRGMDVPEDSHNN